MCWAECGTLAYGTHRPQRCHTARCTCSALCLIWAPLFCCLQALTSGLPQDRAATLQGALQHADTLRPQKPHLMDMHLVIA